MYNSIFLNLWLCISLIIHVLVLVTRICSFFQNKDIKLIFMS